MTKKTLAVTLAILFILPVLCFAGEVEVTGVEVKILDRGLFGYKFRAKIKIVNHARRDKNIRGVLAFYDNDGFEISQTRFRGTVKAEESKVLFVKGWVSAESEDEIASYEAIINKVDSTSW